jgi:hypothetical protein
MIGTVYCQREGTKQVGAGDPATTLEGPHNAEIGFRADPDVHKKAAFFQGVEDSPASSCEALDRQDHLDLVMRLQCENLLDELRQVSYHLDAVVGTRKRSTGRGK